mmetsp:Transcript_30800/g.62893  ORF Transcript_30800/g.62893 Transcript_30800/m.62893 type:complete len:124 (+) Transcript_30800:491-862(+)
MAKNASTALKMEDGVEMVRAAAVTAVETDASGDTAKGKWPERFALGRGVVQDVDACFFSRLGPAARRGGGARTSLLGGANAVIAQLLRFTSITIRTSVGIVSFIVPFSARADYFLCASRWLLS